VLGNPSLKAERSINSDIGFRYQHFQPYHWLHKASFYAGVFYNRIEDLIVRIYNAQGIGIPQNIADADVRGIETTLKLLPSEHHRIDAGFTWTDSLNKTDITSFNNKALPGYYRYDFSLAYSFLYQDWRFSAESIFKRDMYYDRSNLLPGDDINLVNVSVKHKYRQSDIEFSIKNLLNENIEYYRNRPTPGIHFNIAYNQRF